MATGSAQQMMLHLVHDRITTGVTRAVRKSALLRCGDKSGKKYIFTFLGYSLFKNRKQGRMLPLEKK